MGWGKGSGGGASLFQPTLLHEILGQLPSYYTWIISVINIENLNLCDEVTQPKIFDKTDKILRIETSLKMKNSPVVNIDRSPRPIPPDIYSDYARISFSIQLLNRQIVRLELEFFKSIYNTKQNDVCLSICLFVCTEGSR